MKKAWKILIIVLLNILVVSMLICGLPKTRTSILSSASTVYGLSKQGSRGNEVKSIQLSLKNLGFYSGKVDGIFGKATKQAVINFQRQNGLVADGIAGPKTLQALGLTSTIGTGSYNSSDAVLLARVVSAEARGEPCLDKP